MKKYVAAVFLAVSVAAAGFAEFDFGFYGRGVFAPIAFSGEYSAVSAATTTWNNGNKPDIGFTMNGYNQAKTIGMTGTFRLNTTPEIGANANIWVKPLGFLNERFTDILKLTIGKFEVDDFRGKLGSVEFASWILPEGTEDEDTLFYRFKADAGAHIAVRPLGWLGLGIGELILEGAVGSTYRGLRAFMNTYPWDAGDVYAAGQFGLGYDIPGFGLARVQFIGNNRKVYYEDFLTINEDFNETLSEGLSKYSDSDVIEAAFTLTAVENLRVEIGAKIPMKYTTDLPNYVYYGTVYRFNTEPYQTGPINGADSLDVQRPISVSGGGNYVWNALNVMLRLDLTFGGKYEHEGKRTITEGAALKVLGGVNYAVLPNIRIGLDLGFNWHAFDVIEENGKTENIGERKEGINEDVETSERADLGIAPWMSLNMSGGVFKIGVAIMLPSSERWTMQGRVPWQDYSGEPVISIPISVTYSF